MFFFFFSDKTVAEESFTKLTSGCAEKLEDEFADIDALLDELSN